MFRDTCYVRASWPLSPEEQLTDRKRNEREENIVELRRKAEAAPLVGGNTHLSPLKKFILLLICYVHKQIISYSIFSHNFSSRASALWNHSVIICNKKSLSKKDWCSKGIVFVKDLVDVNGKSFRVLDFFNKYNLKSTESQYDKNM